MANWKPISESPAYEVSDRGDVRNSKTGRILKPVRTNGYSQVVLCDADGQHRRSVHRLVAAEFIDNPHGYPVINHIDGNRTNNRVDNLEWCTQSENMKHAYHTGLQKPIRSQIEHSLSRAMEAHRRPVRNIDNGVEYESIAECARQEGLCHSAVSFHLAGKTKRRRFEYADERG